MLGVENFDRPGLRRAGPWFIGAAACLIPTLIIRTYDDGLVSLPKPMRQRDVRDVFVTIGALALLAAEAVFIGRWVRRTLPVRVRVAYLVAFTGITLVVWFVTFVASWAVVPWS